MKITESYLKQLIKEELKLRVKEGRFGKQKQPAYLQKAQDEEDDALFGKSKGEYEDVYTSDPHSKKAREKRSDDDAKPDVKEGRFGKSKQPEYLRKAQEEEDEKLFGKTKGEYDDVYTSDPHSKKAREKRSDDDAKRDVKEVNNGGDYSDNPSFAAEKPSSDAFKSLEKGKTYKLQGIGKDTGKPKSFSNITYKFQARFAARASAFTYYFAQGEKEFSGTEKELCAKLGLQPGSIKFVPQG